MDIRDLHAQFSEHQITMKNFMPDTIGGYRDGLKIFLRFMPHIRQIEQVTVEDAERFFQWAQKHKIITVNPFEGTVNCCALKVVTWILPI